MNLGPKLDRLDFKILAALQRNGRMSNVDLADAVGLSPSPCLNRVKRLEKAGYITGYSAQIAIAKLGSTLTTFTQITLKDHRVRDFQKFEQRAANIDEVIECHLISGGYDYLVKFITRDVTHYQQLIEEILESDFGIEKYFSFIVLKSPIVKRFDPVETLFEEQMK